MEQQESTETQEPVMQKSKRKGKGLLFIIIIIIIVAGAATVYLKSDLLSKVGLDVRSESTVAVVNGVEITAQQVEDRIERNRIALEAQGNDLEDPETLALLKAQIITQLVNEQLVLADVGRLGIAVTDEEVDEQVAVIRSRFETEEDFATELANNRFTETSLRANVERELLIQRYVQQVADSQPIEISPEDVQVVYDQLVAQNEDILSFEELAPQIEDQLRNQQLRLAVDSIVFDLREQADIVIVEEEVAEGETDTDA